jgi:hypothetical protein
MTSNRPFRFVSETVFLKEIPVDCTEEMFIANQRVKL